MSKKATFGGGCFWCTEAIFQRLEGVEQVLSGYSGGKVKDPSYREVCGGRTGHAEVVQITYEPGVISFSDLLRIHLETHDPTTLNRQGADVGTQYRSVVFYHDEEQKEIAESMIEALEKEGIFADPIVTEISEMQAFYRAEDYHQDYYNNNEAQPYCAVVIRPKLDKFYAKFKERIAS